MGEPEKKDSIESAKNEINFFLLLLAVFFMDPDFLADLDPEAGKKSDRIRNPAFLDRLSDKYCVNQLRCTFYWSITISGDKVSLKLVNGGRDADAGGDASSACRARHPRHRRIVGGINMTRCHSPDGSAPAHHTSHSQNSCLILSVADPAP